MTLHALVEGFDVLDDVRSRSIPGEEFDASLLFVVSDGKGNKVFKKTRKTGDYASASGGKDKQAWFWESRVVGTRVSSWRVAGEEIELEREAAELGAAIQGCHGLPDLLVFGCPRALRRNRDQRPAGSRSMLGGQRAERA